MKLEPVRRLRGNKWCKPSFPATLKYTGSSFLVFAEASNITVADGMIFATSIVIIPPNESPINTGFSVVICFESRRAYASMLSRSIGAIHFMW